MFYLDNNTLGCFSQNELTGWKLLLKNDIQTQSDNLYSLANVIISTNIIGLVIMLLFLLIANRSLTLPLVQLRNQLSTLEIDKNIELNLQSYNNEIVYLSNTIESLLNKIRKQNLEINETRKLAYDTQIKVLEAKLDPHFLYNTLLVIGAYGAETNNFAISNMCNKLSGLLRYSINNNNSNVTLKEEIDNGLNYLYIMKMRYEHMLEYKYTFDDSLKDIKIPRFILQPILENCFKHGFKDVEPVWHIDMSVFHDENNWYISVTNNGNKFNKDNYNKLLDQLKKFKNFFILKILIHSLTLKTE